MPRKKLMTLQGFYCEFGGFKRGFASIKVPSLIRLILMRLNKRPVQWALTEAQIQTRLIIHFPTSRLEINKITGK